MKAGIKISLVSGFLLLFAVSRAQLNSLEISPEKEKMFTPYMIWRHSGSEGLAEFKRDHPHDYLKELWYYCESFYIKKDYVKEGIFLDVSFIDITRFEDLRKESDEALILMPGYKDALIMLPSNKLIYRP